MVGGRGIRSCVRLFYEEGGGYVIVDFSLNCVCSYKWWDVDMYVYLCVVPVSCPCHVACYDVTDNIWASCVDRMQNTNILL
jgi:hypothetical protein